MIKQTILAASLLALTGTASAIGTYQYDNFTTTLNGNVGIAANHQYRGITLNDRMTVFADIELTGIEGNLEGFYIGASAVGIDILDTRMKFTGDIGYRNLDKVGIHYNIGLLGTFFDR